MSKKQIGIPTIGKVLIRILAEDRESSFKKEFIKNDGTKGFLFTNTTLKIAPDEYGIPSLEQMIDGDDRKSSVFVRLGTVEAISEGVEGMEVGDRVLLDYKVDNDKDIIVNWIGEDKIVCIPSDTEYFERDIIEYANRRYPQDVLVANKGEIKSVTLIIATIRKGELFARDPYVILKHEQAKKMMVSAIGIMYTDTPTIIKRDVISVSPMSERKYGIKKGDRVLVKELDTFDVLWGNNIITAIDDRDIMAKI